MRLPGAQRKGSGPTTVPGSPAEVVSPSQTKSRGVAQTQGHTRVPWKRLGLALCVLAAIAQLSVSPTSRSVLFSSFMTLPKGKSLAGQRGVEQVMGGSSREGSSWREDMTSLLDSLVKPMTSGGGSGGAASGGSGGRVVSTGAGASKGGGEGQEAAGVEEGPYVGKDGTTECAAPQTGPALDYAAAVKRYLALPWTMRRRGAKTEQITPFNPNHTLTCFTSPYVEGGAIDTAPCGMQSSVFYPTAPKPSGNSTLLLIPDLSREKMRACAAQKAAIARPKVVRKNTLNASYLQWIVKSNISCGPEQLCYYPQPMELDKGGWAEAVNTELGVEIGAYLPFFHYEAAVGELAQSNSNYDSSAFYFWSPKHCEWGVEVQRTANGLGGRTPWPYNGLHFGFVNPIVKRETYPKEGYVQPPWGPHYCGWGLFPFLGQRYAFIHNKRKLVEFMGRMVNTIHPPTLTQLYDLLKDHYVVVYQRPTAGLFKSENDGFQESVDDITTLEAHAAKVGGTLYTMPRLLKDFVDAAKAQGHTPDDVSINEVQMTILAEADIHISVQGGPAYMSMLWGSKKTAVLVQRKSPELPNEAHTWFDLISGMSVETTYSDRDLVSRVRDRYYLPLLPPPAAAALVASFHGLDTPPRAALAARLREKCVTLQSSSGGGRARFELCPFRSANQIVYQSEEVYMLGYWEGGRDELSGKEIAPGGSWIEGIAPGSDPALNVPRGQHMNGGKDCEGAPGTPRRTQVWFECPPISAGLVEHAMVEAGEPSMCVYNVNITLPMDVCFGKAAEAEFAAGVKKLEAQRAEELKAFQNAKPYTYAPGRWP